MPWNLALEGLPRDLLPVQVAHTLSALECMPAAALKISLLVLVHGGCVTVDSLAAVAAAAAAAVSTWFLTSSSSGVSRGKAAAYDLPGSQNLAGTAAIGCCSAFRLVWGYRSGLYGEGSLVHGLSSNGTMSSKFMMGRCYPRMCRLSLARPSLDLPRKFLLHSCSSNLYATALARKRRRD